VPNDDDDYDKEAAALNVKLNQLVMLVASLQ